MFKKSVTVFGRSVPIALIAAALLVVTALGAWYFVEFVFTADVATGAGLQEADFSVYISQGTVVNDAAPTGVQCNFTGGAIDMVDATAGDICRYGWSSSNNTDLTDPQGVYVWPSDHDFPADFTVTDQSCGSLIAAGSTITVEADVEVLDTASPSTAYGPFSLTQRFELGTPTCP